MLLEQKLAKSLPKQLAKSPELVSSLYTSLEQSLLSSLSKRLREGLQQEEQERKTAIVDAVGTAIADLEIDLETKIAEEIGELRKTLQTGAEADRQKLAWLIDNVNESESRVDERFERVEALLQAAVERIEGMDKSAGEGAERELDSSSSLVMTEGTEEGRQASPRNHPFVEKRLLTAFAPAPATLHDEDHGAPTGRSLALADHFPAADSPAAHLDAHLALNSHVAELTNQINALDAKIADAKKTFDKNIADAKNREFQIKADGQEVALRTQGLVESRVGTMENDVLAFQEQLGEVVRGGLLSAREDAGEAKVGVVRE